MLSMNDIRKLFIEFYETRGHQEVRSSPLVPKDDPTLLFTNAGMVQFKQIFQGLEKREYIRAVTSQKCLRVGGKHNDLENVGRTARHHTFFEMLGNFSFGDYFKKQAISYAWEFITKVLNLPEEKLYATVFLDDDEAFDLWLTLTNIPKERIFRMGEKDNFWSMGDTGPCGPCSEILIDQGEHMSCGPDCGIGKCDCDRFLEIWNLVFMQFNQTAPGNRERLVRPSIDTGMGLERITAICQGVYSNYDTDLFQGIINTACDLAGVRYSHSIPDTNDTDTALRVIADHSRAIAFMVADGIMPSNEGRGYVLRRLIRRAYRFGHLIGMPPAFLYLTTAKISGLMGTSFPELISSKEFLARLVKEEEERFEKTLEKGLGILETEILAAKGKPSPVISGEVAFKLYDTYGFPLDIINDICGKIDINVDEEAFNTLMAEQRQRAKAAWKGSGEVDITKQFTTLLEDGLISVFTGYDFITGTSRITALLDMDGSPVPALKKGEKGYAFTGTTPFYGASGGQEGDTGRIETAQSNSLVTSTLKPSDKLTAHAVQVEQGELLLDAEAALTVAESERLASARNHTATHLLHAALQKVLGSHVRQAGSLVDSRRLRFDFTHMSAMTKDEIIDVERRINAAIMADIPVLADIKSYDDAVSEGAMALFGEKYADVVRMVSINSESCELCGGTHLTRTGQAGSFAIISEAGVAAGIRRIEAATGWQALHIMNQQRAELHEAQALLKSRTGELPQRISLLQKELRDTRKQLEKLSSQAASGQGKSLIDNLTQVKGINLLTAHAGTASIKTLRDLMDDLRSKILSGIICLAAEEDGKVSLLLAVTKDLHGSFTAPELIKKIAGPINGTGGGRPDMAQAGGNNAAGIEESFTLLRAAIA